MLILERTASLPRMNPDLAEPLELLDRRYALAKGDPAAAYASLTRYEAEFIAGELMRCTDPRGIKGLRHFLCNYYFIKTKGAGLVPLYPLWESQEIILSAVEERWLARQAIWFMIVKGRQLGCSTLLQGICLALTIFNKNWNSLLMADDPDTTEYVFEMARNGYELLPWWMRPERRYNVKGHIMAFDREDAEDRIENPGLKSQIIAESANQRSGIAYGKNFLFLHATEVAKYRDIAQLTRGVLPTVPENDPAVFAVLEGAAERRHDHWHRMWRAAEAGMTKFEPKFLPWFGEKQYFVPPPAGWVPEKTLLALRKAVEDTYTTVLNNGQLYWYERKRNDFVAFEGDESTFLTQYPSFPEEAFQNAGICAFSKRKLHEMLLVYGRQAIWSGEIRLAENNQEVRLAYRKDDGRLKIWMFPQQARRGDANGYFYVAGDPSGGTATGHPAVWQVFFIPSSPFEPILQVAKWKGQLGPSGFARVGAALGYMYGTAEVCPEANNMGQTVVSDLKNVLNYPRLYRWRREDKVRGYFSDFYGWLMTSASKKALIARFAEALDQGLIIMRDPDTIDECYDFISDDGEQFYAVSEQGHGDQVIAAMIGYYCIYQTRPTKEQSEERKAFLDQRANKDADFANTDFSPAYDKQESGATNEEFMCL